MAGDYSKVQTVLINVVDDAMSQGIAGMGKIDRDSFAMKILQQRSSVGRQVPITGVASPKAILAVVRQGNIQEAADRFDHRLKPLKRQVKRIILTRPAVCGRGFGESEGAPTGDEGQR